MTVVPDTRFVSVRMTVREVDLLDQAAKFAGVRSRSELMREASLLRARAILERGV